MAERLRRLDLFAILRFVHDIRAAPDVESFRRETLRGLRRAIGADNAGYNDLDFETQRITWVDDPVGASRFRGCDDILSRHLLENPVAAHFARTPDKRCLKISDFMSVRAWQRTAVYNEFYRKIDTSHQLSMVFPDRHSSTAVVLHRQSCDFLERDRRILTLLRPHIIQAARDARLVTDLQIDITSLTSGVDSMRVGLILLDEDGHVRLATAKARQLISSYFGVTPRGRDVLPDVLRAWVWCEETSAEDEKRATARAPYVMDRGDGRLVIRLIGADERRLLVFLEERLGVDEQALKPLGLTRRETEVLKWLAEGKRDQEIAVILAISPRTVHHHLEHIYDKLGVETRNGAAAIALRTASFGLE